MNVVLINHSDIRGGASVVTVRLMRALRRTGVEADLLVTHKTLDDPHIHLIGNALTRRAAFLGECLDVYLNNGMDRADLFKASTGRCGVSVHDHPLVRRADAVILNWVNQGTLSLDEIARIGTRVPRILWTMHDMWNVTGICHHAGTCRRYADGCGDCPLVHRPPSTADLSARVYRDKQRRYTDLGGRLTLVPVSTWLAARAAESGLTAGIRTEVIPNAFPAEDYAEAPLYSRKELGLPEGRRLIVMGAARLDDPIKGLPYAIRALNALGHTRAHAVFFGALRDPQALADLKIPHTWLGPVADPERVRALYCHADVVLSTSLYETLPGTVIEGMAAGCYPVTFDRGGQADIITDPAVGALIPFGDTDAMTDAIARTLDHPMPREALHKHIARLFDSAAIARRYIDLINFSSK